MLEHRICSVSIIVSRYCRLCIIQILAYVFGIAKFLNLLFYGFFFICGKIIPVFAVAVEYLTLIIPVHKQTVIVLSVNINKFRRYITKYCYCCCSAVYSCGAFTVRMNITLQQKLVIDSKTVIAEFSFDAFG